MSCAAGTSLHPLAFWPDHSGEKSPLPWLSARAHNGAMAEAASGKVGAAMLIGPTSFTTRFTIPRRPAGEHVCQPITTHGAIVLSVATRGMMEPSAMRRFSTPYCSRHCLDSARSPQSHWSRLCNLYIY